MKRLKLHSMRSLRPARLIQCLIVATLLGHDLNCQGQNNSILLPRPQQINYTDDSLKLTDSPDIYPGNYYERWINKTADTLRSPYRIRLSQHLPQIPLNQEEAYRIEITRQHIFVEAVTTTGVYRAMQTLEQLSRKKEGSLVFPTCQITDWPAFRIRGFMQDVGRTYMSIEELEQEIELLSRFKINVFHWHLTENQAWRLESKLYPDLNADKNMTRMPGKYYTLQEAKKLVEFCRQHHVMLIPEIDMPGHSAAFERTFGTDMQSAEGMKILKNILDEVCETFDVPYIHIGTDEVQFTNPSFVPEMVAYLRSKGKKVISWNPGWKYRPGEIDMTQLWSFRGKAQQGIPAIDCRFHYINHFDLFADIITLYNSRIYDCTEGNESIAGSILAVWNDRYIDNEKQIVRENNFYANMLAIAERSWLGGGYGYFNGKYTMLRDSTPKANLEFADFERRLLWHKRHTLSQVPIPYVKQTQVRWRITDPFPNGGDLQKAFPPETNSDTVYIYNGQTYKTHTAQGAGIYLRHVWGDLVPGFYEHPQEMHTAYATTWVFSPQEQEAGLLLEFQNYSRSESDLPPLPGTWDYKGSRAWLNDKEILPPVWENTHRQRSSEIPLGNENCVSRPPLPVKLHKGWNKLLLKLPVGKFQIPETRLVKWMFTAVFVTPDGKEALENIIYAPDKYDTTSNKISIK